MRDLKLSIFLMQWKSIIILCYPFSKDVIGEIRFTNVRGFIDV